MCNNVISSNLGTTSVSLASDLSQPYGLHNYLNKKLKQNETKHSLLIKKKIMTPTMDLDFTLTSTTPHSGGPTVRYSGSKGLIKNSPQN